MRKTLLAIAIVISGLSGNLQASTKKHHPPRPASASLHKARKGKAVVRKRIAGDPPPPIRAVAPPAAEAGPAVSQVEPLPGTPAIGPASLVHLERILPSEVRGVPPAAGKETSERVGPAASASLTALRKVLPADDGADDGELEIEPLVDPNGFDLADRDNLDLLWPVETRTISSAWGPRMRTRVVRKASKASHSKRVIRRFLGSHRGVDLSAPRGTDIYAALDGKVVACGRHKEYGNFVAVDHGNGVMTLYAHNNRNLVADGDLVRRGQKIAEVGRTGNATGPHLHFELRLDGLPQNPLPRLNDAEEIPADLVAQNQAAAAGVRR